MVTVVFISGLFAVAYQNTIEDPEISQFAQCLTESGAIMYGVDTCPACTQQKGIFGPSFSHIEYIECRFDPAACQRENIQSYPTWVFDGEHRIGVLDLYELASWTDCDLIA